MAHTEYPERRRSMLPVVVVVLLLVIYPAALGPLKWLYEQGTISPRVAVFLNDAYAPLRWIEDNTDFFEHPPGSAFVWYVELFVP